MIESNLLSALEAANLGHGIIFQVSHTDRIIVVVANRPEPQPLDYNRLKAKILKIVQKLDIADISTLCLYSRVLGEESTDWHEEIAISQTIDTQQPESQPTKPQAANPQVANPQVGTSHEAILETKHDETKHEETSPKAIREYCFGLSDYLIGTIAEPPEPEIAEIVMFFHELTDDERALILPALEQFFATRDSHAFKGYPDKFSEWLQKLEGFSNRKQRAASVWLARYCAKGEEILGVVTRSLPKQTVDPQVPSETLPAADTADSPPPQRISRNTEGARNTGGGTSSRVEAPGSRVVSVQSVDPNANIKPMAIALVPIGLLIGWLFSGLLKLTPMVATIGFIHGFIWALGVSYGNQLFLGSTVFNVAILVFFRGYFMSQGIGILAGLATAGGIKISARSPEAGSKFFGPRGFTATGSTLLGVILGVILLGGGISSQNPSIATSGTGTDAIVIVEREIFAAPNTLPKGQLSVRAVNKTAASCQLVLQSESETTEPATDATSKLTLLSGIGSSDVPLNLTPGSYSIFCEENQPGKASFIVEP